MSTDHSTTPAEGQRGPADHDVRDRIVVAARAHFSRFGYSKTTVADLAKAIGFSKAYVYKFFESKQAIGEAICSQTLEKILSAGEAGKAEGKTASEKLRLFFNGLVKTTVTLVFEEELLYEIAMHAVAEGWSSTTAYAGAVEATVRDIVLIGRGTGEFERKTPIDETSAAIMLVIQGFINPLMLKSNLRELPEGPTKVINLVLRSLAA